MIPDYIREQVLNAKLPDGCCVPGGSVPAVAEGHFTFARAATVGINPHGSWNRKDYLPKECLTLDRDYLDEQFLNRVWEECCQSAKVGQIGTREDYCYEELRVSSLRVLL